MTDTSEVAAYEASIEDHRNRRRDRKRTTKMVVDGASVKHIRVLQLKHVSKDRSAQRRSEVDDLTIDIRKHT